MSLNICQICFRTKHSSGPSVAARACGDSPDGDQPGHDSVGAIVPRTPLSYAMDVIPAVTAGLSMRFPQILALLAKS